MPEYPTPAGDFEICQVTWNPDRRPPDSEWSEDESYMEPDDPDNPMGKVKIMWKAPDYTIHGTDEYDSLGKNVSDGSVRIAKARRDRWPSPGSRAAGRMPSDYRRSSTRCSARVDIPGIHRHPG